MVSARFIFPFLLARGVTSEGDDVNLMQMATGVQLPHTQPADPMCATGIAKSSGACCPASCGRCGGRGCNKFDPAVGSLCCSGPYRDLGISCEDSGPPCVIGLPSARPPAPAPPPILCPNMPVRVSNMVPKDIIPQLDQNWKLQLPCESITTTNGVSECTGDYTTLLRRNDSPGVHTVEATDLTAFQLMPKSYSSTFCSGGFFVAADDDGVNMVVFNVPVAGTTTSGSDNPRVELREMVAGAPSKMAGFALDNSAGMNKLTTTQSVVHVPPVYQSTSVVQIFNAGYSATPPSGFSGGGPFIEIITQKCRYSWQKLPNGDRCPVGTLAIGVWKDSKFGGRGGFLFEPYTLGTKFTIDVEVPGDGTLTFKYKHAGAADWLTENTIDCNNVGEDINPCLYYGDHGYPKSNGVYFKVGSYIQKAADEAPDEYALSYVYGATLFKP